LGFLVVQRLVVKALEFADAPANPKFVNWA